MLPLWISGSEMAIAIAKSLFIQLGYVNGQLTWQTPETRLDSFVTQLKTVEILRIDTFLKVFFFSNSVSNSNSFLYIDNIEL